MFVFTEEAGGCTLQMSATLANISLADERITKLLADRQIPVDLFAVRSALHEALLNAVIHGCGKDDRHTVETEVSLAGEALQIRIRDPGEGFPVTRREGGFEVMGDGGRGLALMSIYADEVEFNGTGNEVILGKRFKARIPAGSRAGGEENAI